MSETEPERVRRLIQERVEALEKTKLQAAVDALTAARVKRIRGQLRDDASLRKLTATFGQRAVCRCIERAMVDFEDRDMGIEPGDTNAAGTWADLELVMGPNVIGRITREN